MKRSRIILLTFLSLLMLLPGCYMSQYSKKSLLDMGDPTYHELMPFAKGFEKALYKAYLEVNGREFSGLMMIKESAEGNFKVAFFSEIGLNFFDFELRDIGGMNHLNLYVRNIYEPLDKDILLNKFEKYFSMLLGDGPAGGQVKTYLHKENPGIMIMTDSYKGKDGYISTNLMEPYKEKRKDHYLYFSSKEKQLSRIYFDRTAGIQLSFQSRAGKINIAPLWGAHNYSKSHFYQHEAPTEPNTLSNMTMELI